MSWFSRPTDSDFNKFKETGDNGFRELWKYEFGLKKGEKRNVLFLDDARISVYKHTMPLGNKWLSFICSGDDQCYGCGTGVNKQYVQYSSLLDLTPFKDKEGKERKWSKRLYPMVGEANILSFDRRRQEKGGDLTGYKAEIFRDGEKSPRCGNDWTIKEKADMSKVPADDAKPIDYMKILMPPKASVIEAKVRFSGGSATTPRGSLNPAAGLPGVVEDAEQDVPF